MAFTPSIATLTAQGQQILNNDFDVDMETDEEVDQLESSQDEDVPLAASTASTSRPRKKERTNSHSTSIPLDRVETIVHADASMGHMSKEAYYMLSKATEEFVKRLTASGYREAMTERRPTIDYRDVASATTRSPSFKFLEDTVPAPITLFEAMQRRAAKERELLEDNPAISAAAPRTSTPLPAPTGPSVSHPGTEKPPRAPRARPGPPPPQNGDGPSARSLSAQKRQRDSKGRWSMGGKQENGSASANGSGTPRAGSVRARQKSARVMEGDPAYAAHNGSASATRAGTAERAWTNGSATPPPPQPGRAGENAGWRGPTQYTGPASGYLEDGGRMVFGMPSMTDAPGRTIYSAQRPPAR